jgi:hypothetical protein
MFKGRFLLRGAIAATGNKIMAFAALESLNPKIAQNTAADRRFQPYANSGLKFNIKYQA